MHPDHPHHTAERVNLATVIVDLESELRCLLGPLIGLITGRLPAGGAPLVWARRDEIMNLLRHLALDAHDAMPAGGALTIRTGRLPDVAECAAIIMHEVPEPAAAEPASTRLHKGRSLSLGATYDSIERAGGHFHVSCRGRETVVTICFPLAS